MTDKRISYAGAPNRDEWRDQGERRKRNASFASFPTSESAEAYDVGYFAQKHGLNRAKAIDILMRAGRNRKRADELAARIH